MITKELIIYMNEWKLNEMFIIIIINLLREHLKAKWDNYDR